MRLKGNRHRRQSDHRPARPGRQAGRGAERLAGEHRALDRRPQRAACRVHATVTTPGANDQIILEYLGTWVQQNPPVPAGTWDWTTTTYDRFDQLFQQSVDPRSSRTSRSNSPRSGSTSSPPGSSTPHGREDVRQAPRRRTESIEAMRPEDIADTVASIVIRDRQGMADELLIRASEQPW